MSQSKVNALSLLLYAAEKITHQAREDNELGGFSGAQAQLAMHLEHGAVRAHDLAQRMRVSKQAVAQLIDTMVAEGTLARHPDSVDRRAKVIQFTARGDQYLQKHKYRLAEIEARLAEQAGDKAMSRLRKSLTRILPHLAEESSA